MALNGNPPAAAAAVAALLLRDRRFRQEPDGRWALVRRHAHGTHALQQVRFAVVDVETTGGLRWRGHGIVEIAIVEIRDGVIGETYQTLLNPGRRIPPFVTELTGITSGMVADAPLFEHVAAHVAGLLEGRVFVAHNVGFDWGFVRSHLQRVFGAAPEVPRLCTVHLARRLLPRLRRRNLDALADHFGIEIHARHRAYGDALATARILLRLLDEASRRGIYDLRSLQRFLAVDDRRGQARFSERTHG